MTQQAMIQSELPLAAKNLYKIYSKDVPAIKDVSLDISTNCVYGLVGANGAGKSTFLRLAMGLLRPTTGEINIWGENPQELSIKKKQRIGYCSETMTLPEWLKVYEVIGFNKSFYPDWDETFCKEIVEIFKLPLDRKIKTLSRGEQRKVALLLALGHKPDFLILDEPFGGLDPAVRQEFIDTIINLLDYPDKTIIISSHLITDLERLSTHIGFIAKGQIQFSKTIEDLKGEVKKVRLIFPEKVPENLTFSDAFKLQKNEREVMVTFKNWSQGKMGEIKKQYPQAGLEIFDLTLEQIVVEFMKEPI